MSIIPIVDKPIRLIAVDNIISLDENSVEEVMESNSYPVEVNTNEDLKDCNLVLRRYGFTTTELIPVAEEIPKRFIKFKIQEDTKDSDGTQVTNDTENTEQKKYYYYWGFLIPTNSNEQENIETIEDDTGNTEEEGEIIRKFFKAYLYCLVPKSEPTVIPEITKISEYLISEEQQNNYIIGYFKYNYIKEEYEFIPTEFSLIDENNRIETTKIDNINSIELFTKINDFPDIPEIQEDITNLEDIKIDCSGKFESDDIENLEFQIEAQKLNFESYDEEDGIYFYSVPLSYSFVLENKNIEEGTENTESTEGTNNAEDIGGIEKGNITLDSQFLTGYSKVEFEGILRLKFQENNFSDYDLELTGSLETTKINSSNIEESTEGTEESRILNTYNIYITKSIDLTFSFDNLTYKGKTVLKEDFYKEVEIPEYINTYKFIIDSNLLVLNLKKFLLGIKKFTHVEGDQLTSGEIVYATNGIIISVEPSIDTIPWDGIEIEEQQYVIGQVEETDGKIIFKVDNKEILGDNNTLYVDKNIEVVAEEENTEGTEGTEGKTEQSIIKQLKNIKIYKWNPTDGFYLLQTIDNIT